MALPLPTPTARRPAKYDERLDERLEIPADAPSHGPHELQRMLLERIAGHSELVIPAPSRTAQTLESWMELVSRASGPILFCAAVAGLIALSF